MTTGISLVRENTESMQPPRMLWASFPLGHPLGKPGDAEFQHKVIGHALDLLERPVGPVLEDFPLDIPNITTEQAPACPISFAKPSLDNTTWQSRLSNELLLFKPWYDLNRRRRGRTTVGACSSSIDEILTRFSTWLDQPETQLPDLKWLKYAIEDAKAFYSESLIAQPGDYPTGQIQQQFWHETVLGEALNVFYQHFIGHPKLSIFARLVATRESIGGSTGSDDVIHQPSLKTGNPDD